LLGKKGYVVVVVVEENSIGLSNMKWILMT